MLIPIHILLLKNPDETASSDPYQQTLLSHGFSSTIVPTLTHTYTDPDRLVDIITQGEYGGVIVTSSRAVDAWSNALKILSGRDKSTLDPHSDRATRQGGRSWKSVPFYVVGPRTERQLLDLRSESSWCDWLPAPELVLGAKESGTGEALAKFICADYPTRSSSHLPLLYLIGDKNAGGVERGLKESGIGVHMTQVYATSASGTFSGDFEKGVKEGEGKAFVVVFFAPSSAELALPVLQKHFTVRSSSAQSDTAEQKPLVKVAAIGPTTARALADKHRIQVDVVSEKPEPSALAEAIHLLSST